MLFFNIDFFRFEPRFCRVLGLQLGAKSAALLAAPGVLNPIAFYACINILHFLTRGGQDLPNSQVRPGHVEAMLAQFSLLGAFFSLLAGS